MTRHLTDADAGRVLDWLASDPEKPALRMVRAECWECTTCDGSGTVLREVVTPLASWDAQFPCEACNGEGWLWL